ncbi:Pentatricopeptide repeat superfamily protein putative isoform 2 [Tripterygium wilfordii]|uniref:Pentatricopeptide repeat superfamily protein putative isoform 2 n=3 Tax=Tripterygium wilfordii TaxID=458696 RepID=A0A7J7BY86_TRIWF|nr:Pentatricopeptide repeat superfamily protein putative isoform 2 [Tripterygium wilfordii]
MLNDLFNIRWVVRDMLQHGYYPNVISFEKILKCFCKMDRLPEAQHVLGVMITLGISFSEAAWSMVINLFCKLHQLGTAGSLLRKMVDTGCSPNVVTYTVLIKGYIESQMVTDAFNILSKMLAEGKTPDLVLYNVLIYCLSKAGRYDDALDVFISLSEQKLVPDSYTFCSLLSAICLSRRFTLLPKLVARFVGNADIMVLNSLLSYYCKAGFPSLAVELCVEMLNRGFTLDEYSFVGFINGLCGARRIDEAVSVYLHIGKNHSNLGPHVHTVIMGGLIKEGKYHRAIKLFRRAIDENYPLDAVSYMVGIIGLIKGKKSGEASSFYNQMKELDMYPNAHTYSVLLSFFCEERNTQMVEQLLEDITQAGIELENKTLARVSKFLCKYHPKFRILRPSTD